MPRTSLTDLLNLASAPVAISFVDAAPPNVPRVSAVQPAGCSYWSLAAAGEVFFTTADDHIGCLIGAHTHHVALGPAEQQELNEQIQTMVGLSYIKMADVPQIPTRKAPLSVAVYAPLAAAPVPPDVVLVRGDARQLMLLVEAAEAAGVAGRGVAMGRPTCAMLPLTINTSRTAASFGCIGNRVYTGTGDTETYFAIPGAQLAALEESLAAVVHANQELEQYHRGRVIGAERASCGKVVASPPDSIPIGVPFSGS